MEFLSFISILVLVAIGALSGVVYVKEFNKRIFGNIWGAIVVGIIGGVLGGYFLNKFEKFINEKIILDVNFSASFVGAFFLLWVLSKLSHQD